MAGETLEITAEPAEGHQFHSWSGDLSSDPYGTPGILTASPGFGYGFSHWESSELEVSTRNPYSFVIQEDSSLTAVFLETAIMT